MHFYAIWYWRILSFSFKGTITDLTHSKTFVNISDEETNTSQESIHDYFLFLLIHVGWNSCKCIKLWLALFNILRMWLLHKSWPSITSKSFYSKLLEILAPIRSILSLSEVTVVEVFFLLWHFSGLPFILLLSLLSLLWGGNLRSKTLQ